MASPNKALWRRPNGGTPPLSASSARLKALIACTDLAASDARPEERAAADQLAKVLRKNIR